MTERKSSAASCIDALLNKDAFLPHLQTFLAAHPEGQWCVAAIDVEHFKLYNEWYGLQKGDALLEALAACLLDYQTRTNCPAGYFGNDDFFVCLPDEDTAIYELYHKLQACVDQNETGVSFYVAMGVCAAEGRKADCHTLCSYAQIAAANHRQSNGSLERFQAPMLDRLKQRQQLLSELERALKQEEFCFYLQPKCNSMTKAIVGMEALVRWNHPTRGVVAPGEFIPLLEETGLVTQLDLYLWESVCKMLHRWKTEKRNLVPISVNVSIADITSLDVAKVFGELVERYQLEPKLVLVEITESMMARNMRLVENTIKGLHRKGFSVLMDDFGSGYSSLNMLKDASVDGIKLDLKFIDMNRANEGKGKQIVESVVEMAHRLHLPIIAEGVENQEQVYLLQSMDCLYTQGYYFYRPMTVQDAESLLAQPANESYWDLKRDLIRRDHKAFTGGLVSEKSAIALQAFQIISDNVLELGRLNLMTGEYRSVKRDSVMPGGAERATEDFATHCRELAETFLCKDEVKPFCERFGLEALRTELFASPRPIFCRWRKVESAFCPWMTMEILPARGCSKKEPWAVVMVREMK